MSPATGAHLAVELLHRSAEIAPGGFGPDEARAARAAAAIDCNLLASLDYLADACSARIAIELDGLQMLRGALAAGRAASPAHYAIHFALLDAIAEENDDAVRDRFAMLGKVAAIDDARSVSHRVALLDADTLGAETATLYLHNIDADTARPLNLVAPPAMQLAAAESQITEAMNLIWRIAPELGGEVTALARQIVLAADQSTAAHPFYGASTFFLWGAVFFNPLRHATAYEAAETLVHEAAHTLLTALAREVPLVANPRAARYRAPVRQDPRPMEGIYHATFVLARTCLFHRAAVAAPDLPPEMHAIAASAAARDARYFRDGFATIRAEADLSELGRTLIEDAARFVNHEA